MVKECKYCKKQIEFEKGSQFGGHITNCKENPNRNVSQKIKKEYSFKCIKCYEKYSLLLYENQYNKKDFRIHCSRKCANSRIITEKHKLKTSVTINNGSCAIFIKPCPNCDKLFTSKNKIKKYCNKNCNIEHFNKLGFYILNARKGGLKAAASNIIRSKNEILFADLCMKYFKDIECNKQIFNGWDADVIIHDLKIAVMWNGVWHYKKITKKHSLKQVQNRDKIKIKEILNFGYEPYIIKDLGGYDPKFVQEQFDLFIKEKVS